MTLTLTGCIWCGLSHGPRCPHVKSIEYDTSTIPATIKRVEFFPIGETGMSASAKPYSLPKWSLADVPRVSMPE